MSETGAAAPRFAPYAKGRFQLTLGIKEIAADQWIEIDHHYADHMAEKKRLLAGRYGDVFAALPESLPAQRECLVTLLADLWAHHPTIIEDAGETVRTSWDGAALTVADFDAAPLDLAGRLVQEDLCLMAPHADGHRLVAASLCFPARWRLADKIGRPMSAIHEPVPGFNARLNRPVERFFTRIEPGRLYMRLNWSVLDDPALFQSTGHGRHAVDPSFGDDSLAERLHIRVERQTFRRLPESGALVFGIKTIVDPLSVIADRPALAAGMLGSLRTMPDDMRAYKSMAPFAGPLEAWLHARTEPV